MRTVGISGILLATVIFLYACDNFLESPPQGSLSETVLQNKMGVEGNLIAAYALLDGYDGSVAPIWGSASSNWVFGSAVSDNSYKGSESGDQQPIDEIELLTWGSSGVDQYLEAKWIMLYDGVSRANATLSLLPNVEDLSATDANRIEGEAKFLRAHYHFEAWKMWGNIPFFTEEDDVPSKPNTEPVIPKILTDLDVAIEKLPPSQDDAGRVNAWTARAYKGRVQAYSGDYQGALTTLREVVNNGPFELVDTFWQVFSAFNDNHPETVLAFQATVNDGDPNGDNGNRQDRLNFPHSGSPFGCCGFHQASQNLANAFQVDANGLPLPLSDPDGWNDPNETFDASVPVDPRIDFTMGRDNVPFLDWDIHSPAWIRDRGFSGPYSPKKTIYEQSSGVSSNVGWSPFQLHSKNLHLYRYADVLLLLAEAEVEAGTLENARAIVNQIRERAAQTAQGPLENIEVPIDDSSITWATYQIGTYDDPWTDQEFAREAVRMERRLELAMEGHRLFDLRRWGIAAEVMGAYFEKESILRPFLNNRQEWQPRHNLYPLPTTEISLSEVDGEQQLQQNPGW